MNVELRPITPDEHREFTSVMEGAFGSHVSEEARADYQTVVEFDRTIAAFDGAEMVATAGAYTMELTLPGGRLEPTAGVTYVGVRNTHRRRGLLRAMMDHQIDDIADRGENLAALTASEGSIYRRFGYGPASFQANWQIPTEGTSLARPPDTSGRLRQVTSSEAAPLLPKVYERCRAAITGAINRTQAWWDIYFKDEESERDGASARFYVIHESAAGEVDGCLAFRQRRSWDHGLAGNTIVVDELYSTTPEVEAALWAHVIDHDLVGTVEAPGRPVDDPVRWWLNDPRRLTCTSLVDALWIRPMDIPRALAARTYPVDGALILGISDPFRPANNGTYLVDGGPAGAEASRTDRDPDLSMDIADLGSIYLGGVPATTLARGGRIVEHTAGALARADAFFATHPLPWLTTGF